MNPLANFIYFMPRRIYLHKIRNYFLQLGKHAYIVVVHNCYVDLNSDFCLRDF